MRLFGHMDADLIIKILVSTTKGFSLVALEVIQTIFWPKSNTIPNSLIIALLHLTLKTTLNAIEVNSKTIIIFQLVQKFLATKKNSSLEGLPFSLHPKMTVLKTQILPLLTRRWINLTASKKEQFLAK